jgi:Ser/Thr protein kinase RdoA (MazF antagonist)
MLDIGDALNIVKSNYSLKIDNIEFNRDGGSISYVVFTGQQKFFLRVIRPELMNTSLQSINIHLYLAGSAFPVPDIIYTNDGKPYVSAAMEGRNHLLVMYEFIEGQEPKRDDLENIGKLVGQFHSVMKGYTGRLTVCDKHFFIDRYIEILKKKHYTKTDAFNEIGNALWESVKDLPCGYCHCDLYRGNVHKANDGTAYILDFDTSCIAFPMYDVVLFCNETDYFAFKSDGLQKTKRALKKFLAGYMQQNTLSQAELMSFGNLLAVYHFQLQATIIEIYGLDCVDEEFLDQQLDWLLRWQKQCDGESWL